MFVGPLGRILGENLATCLPSPLLTERKPHHKPQCHNVSTWQQVHAVQNDGGRSGWQAEGIQQAAKADAVVSQWPAGVGEDRPERPPFAGTPRGSVFFALGDVGGVVDHVADVVVDVGYGGAPTCGR